MTPWKKDLEQDAKMRHKIRIDLSSSSCPHNHFQEVDITWLSTILGKDLGLKDEIWHKYMCLGCYEVSDWFVREESMRR